MDIQELPTITPCDDYPLYGEKGFEIFQDVLSFGQAIPFLGPLVVSPIKVTTSLVALVTFVAGAIFFKALDLYSPSVDYKAKTWACLRMQKMCLIHLFYGMVNAVTFGLAGIAIEGWRWHTVLFPTKDKESKKHLKSYAQIAQKSLITTRFLLRPSKFTTAMILRIAKKRASVSRPFTVRSLTPFSPILFLTLCRLSRYGRWLSLRNADSRSVTR